jgi:PAS domain S-box-containing protein
MARDEGTLLEAYQNLKNQLSASRARFKNIIEGNSDGMLIVDQDDGTVFYLNAAAEQMLGRPREELIGEVIGFPIRRAEKSEIDIIRPDGTFLVAEMNVVETVWEEKPALLAALRDITQRVSMENALRRSEERFRRAIENAPFPIMIHAEDGEVIVVNRVWLDLTGYSREEIATIADWTEKAYGEERGLIREQIRELYDSETRTAEGHFLIRTRMGDQRIWDFSSAPLGKLPDGRRSVVSMAMDVTDQVRAEEERDTTTVALRTREKEFQRLSQEFEAILDHIPALVFYKDKENRFVRVNKKLADAHQRGKEELEGLHLSEIYPEYQSYLENDREVIQSGEPKLNIIEPWQTETEQRWVSTSKLPFRDAAGKIIGVIGISMDVTELKETQQALERQVEENQAAADISQALVGLASVEEISRMVLEKSRELTNSAFGYVGFIDPESGSLICPTMTREVWDACQVEEKDIVFEKFGGLWGWVLENKQSLVTNNPADDPRSTGIPSGHLPVERFLSAPALIGDELVGQIALINADRDYTSQDLRLIERLADIYALTVQRVRAQKQLQSYAENLEEMVEERTRELKDAQQKLVRQERLAVLGELAGGVGHELRNPLGVMSNAIYFLKMVQPDTSGKIGEYHEILESEINKAEKIVSDLMDFARLERPTPRQVEINEIVSKVLERRQPDGGIETRLEIPDPAPQAAADPDHVDQILHNLVSNACQAMPEGGILTITVENHADQVLINVKDTGKGISPENQENIFQPLFTTKSRGIGLGLAISDKLAHVNGGMIDFETVEGEGTTFCLQLPGWSGEP